MKGTKATRDHVEGRTASKKEYDTEVYSQGVRPTDVRHYIQKRDRSTKDKPTKAEVPEATGLTRWFTGSSVRANAALPVEKKHRKKRRLVGCGDVGASKRAVGCMEPLNPGIGRINSCSKIDITKQGPTAETDVLPKKKNPSYVERQVPRNDIRAAAPLTHRYSSGRIVIHPIGSATPVTNMSTSRRASTTQSYNSGHHWYPAINYTTEVTNPSSNHYHHSNTISNYRSDRTVASQRPVYQPYAPGTTSVVSSYSTRYPVEPTVVPRNVSLPANQYPNFVTNQSSGATRNDGYVNHNHYGSHGQAMRPICATVHQNPTTTITAHQNGSTTVKANEFHHHDIRQVSARNFPRQFSEHNGSQMSMNSMTSSAYDIDPLNKTIESTMYVPQPTHQVIPVPLRTPLTSVTSSPHPNDTTHMTRLPSRKVSTHTTHSTNMNLPTHPVIPAPLRTPLTSVTSSPHPNDTTRSLTRSSSPTRRVSTHVMRSADKVQIQKTRAPRISVTSSSSTSVSDDETTSTESFKAEIGVKIENEADIEVDTRVEFEAEPDNGSLNLLKSLVENSQTCSTTVTSKDKPGVLPIESGGWEDANPSIARGKIDGNDVSNIISADVLKRGDLDEIKMSILVHQQQQLEKLHIEARNNYIETKSEDKEEDNGFNIHQEGFETDQNVLDAPEIVFGFGGQPIATASVNTETSGVINSGTALPIIGFALPDGTMHSAFGGSAQISATDMADPVKRTKLAIDLNTKAQREILIEAHENGTDEVYMAEGFMNEERLQQVLSSLTGMSKFDTCPYKIPDNITKLKDQIEAATADLKEEIEPQRIPEGIAVGNIFGLDLEPQDSSYSFQVPGGDPSITKAVTSQDDGSEEVPVVPCGTDGPAVSMLHTAGMEEPSDIEPIEEETLHENPPKITTDRIVDLQNTLLKLRREPSIPAIVEEDEGDIHEDTDLDSDISKAEKRAVYEAAVKQFEESKKALDRLKECLGEDSETTDVESVQNGDRETRSDAAESVRSIPSPDGVAPTTSAGPEKPWESNLGEGLDPDFELQASLSIHDVIKYVESNKLPKDAIISEHISTFEITAVPTGIAPVDQLLPPDENPRGVEKYQLVKDPNILFLRDVITQAEVLAIAHLASKHWNVYDGVPQRRSVGGSGYIRIAKFPEDDLPDIVSRFVRRMTQLCGVDPKLQPVIELREILRGSYLPCGFEPVSATAYIFLKNPADGGKVVFPCANLTLSPELGSSIMWTNSADGTSFDVRVLNQTTPVTDAACAQMMAVIQWLDPSLSPPEDANQSAK